MLGKNTVDEMSATTPTPGFHNGVPGHWVGATFIPRMAGGEDDPKPGEGDPPKGDDPPKDDDDAFDKERALATIRRLRESEREGKANKKALDEALAKLQAIEDKDKSETERAAAQAKDATEKLAVAEQRATELALRLVVERTAVKLGFHDPDDAYRLIDRKAVETDDDGEPSNVESLLKALAKQKPHLVKAEGDGEKKPAASRTAPESPKPQNGQTSPDDDKARRAAHTAFVRSHF